MTRFSRLQLKDCLTLANACCGLLALPVFAFFGYMPAFTLVVLAIAFDFLDGIAARRKGEQDEFGKQLDSLADAVSFAAIPPMIVLFNVLAAAVLPETFEQQQVFLVLLLLGCLFYASCGILRLARFNVQKEKGVYYGLPAPAAAFLLLAGGWVNYYVAVALLFALGGLMVSGFRLRKVFS